MDINELKTKRIGLVLSGGGAKGAYQVGMFRALEELGLAGSITAMSGTSIGAYAELIYALKGADEYRRFLFDFPELIADGTVLSQELIDAAKAEVSTGAVTKERFCSERRFYRFEAKGLREYFENLLAEVPMITCSIPMTACCYSIEEERPEYFRLNGLTVNDCISAVIGSAGLPYLFEPVKIGTSHYLDGGVIPNICKAPRPADKIPLRAMLGEKVDAIIVNYLIPSDNADRTGFPPDLPIIELRPSVPLEDRPGSGTSDFSPASLEWREKLGYEDTMKLFRGETET